MAFGVIVLVLTVSTGFCVNYYVVTRIIQVMSSLLAPSVDDANSGLTPLLPKRTLTNLFHTITLTGGDTLYIDTGTYPEEISLKPARLRRMIMAAVNNYLVIRGAGTNNTKIDGGSTGGGVFKVSDRTWIKFADMRLNASFGHENIWLDSSTNCMVTNCKLYQAQKDGALAGGEGITISDFAKNNKLSGAKLVMIPTPIRITAF